MSINMHKGCRENPWDAEACSNPNVTSEPLVGSWSATGRIEDEKHTFTQHDLNTCLPGGVNKLLCAFNNSLLTPSYNLAKVKF